MTRIKENSEWRRKDSEPIFNENQESKKDSYFEISQIRMNQQNEYKVIFTHFMGGYTLPPFFILPRIFETRDRNDLLDISSIFLASNESGWMTEAMFTLWYLVFSCQLTQYKLANNNDPTEQVLLILDGHTSRTNVLGLEILKKSHVTVFTLI